MQGKPIRCLHPANLGRKGGAQGVSPGQAKMASERSRTASKLPLANPPSQTGLHHLSQCCLGCLDQGLSYPVQLSYTVPPFKILERYWLEGRLRGPLSSDLEMHLLSNLGTDIYIYIYIHIDCARQIFGNFRVLSNFNFCAARNLEQLFRFLV